MKIAVSCIPWDRGRSGISVYVRETVRALAAQGHELTLVVEPGVDADEIAGGAARAMRVLRAPAWSRRPVPSMLWHLLFLPRILRRMEKSGRAGAFFICAANRRVCASYPLPTVATVHDLANFHVKGKYSRLRMFYLARVLPRFAKKAQRLVAVSRATKSDMVEFWRASASRVAVLYNGAGTAGSGAARPPARRPDAAGGSILYISRIEHPGKNHVRLIEAYGRLPPDVAAAHPLVLAGADWKDAAAVKAAAAASPAAAHIRFAGFVPDGEMEALWRQAGFYVFPSLFEGFGLSLVEAMRRGVPCACSENGSLGEIASGAAETFDPRSVDSIFRALAKLLGESAQDRAARIERGYAAAKRFSWEDHAKGVAALLESAAAERGVCRLFGIPVAKTTQAAAVERIIGFAKTRRSDPSRPAAFVATLNVDFVANAVPGFPFDGNGELWGYLKNADLVTADGMPIVLLSRILRNPLPGRVTGADMTPELIRRCAGEGLSIYVLGGDRAAVEEALPRCGPARPVLAGVDDSFVDLEGDQSDAIARINAASPDILFVALGNPKQELWIGRNIGRLRAGAVVGVGGTFNFLSGRVKRAPRWAGKCGLEWIYRIIQEPRRLWRRYAFGLVKFSWLSLLALFGFYRDAEDAQ